MPRYSVDVTQIEDEYEAEDEDEAITQCLEDLHITATLIDDDDEDEEEGDEAEAADA